MGLAMRPKVTEVTEKLKTAVTQDAYKGTFKASPKASHSWGTVKSQVGETTHSHS